MRLWILWVFGMKGALGWNQCLPPILSEFKYPTTLKRSNQSLPQYVSFTHFLNTYHHSSQIYQIRPQPGLQSMFDFAEEVAPNISDWTSLNHTTNVPLLEDCMYKTPNPEVREYWSRWDRSRLNEYGGDTNETYDTTIEDPFWKDGHNGVLHGRWRLRDWEQYYEKGMTPKIIESLNGWLDLFLSVHKSGHFYYLPGSVRAWHTNRQHAGPGFRAYIVRTFGGKRSGLNVLSYDKSVANYPDLEGMMFMNLFRISYDPPLWHCVYNEDSHRISVGIKLTLFDAYQLLLLSGNALDSDGYFEYLKEYYLEEEKKEDTCPK